MDTKPARSAPSRLTRIIFGVRCRTSRTVRLRRFVSCRTRRTSGRSVTVGLLRTWGLVVLLSGVVGLLERAITRDRFHSLLKDLVHASRFRLGPVAGT